MSSDYEMPGMDGQLFRDTQKADARLSAIPVILLTAHRVSNFDALAIYLLSVFLVVDTLADGGLLHNLTNPGLRATKGGSE